MWRLKLYRDYWCATRRHQGKTQRISLRTKDRSVAERELKDLTAPAKADIIGNIMEAYIEDKKEAGKRSINAMRASWKALKPTFGHLRPDQVTRPLCRDYAKLRHKGGVGDGTVIKDLGVLKAALGWAKQAGNAVFEMPPQPPPRDRYLTRQEVEKLWNAAESAHVELFIKLAWATAGRASAILELTWDRVDFERGNIRLSTGAAGQKGRAFVPMTDTLRTALSEAHRVRTTDYVIEWGGAPIKNVAKGFQRAAQRAKIKNISPHIIRHSSAVRMVTEGVDLYEVGQFLGHTDPRITYKTYARFRPEHMGKAKAALE